MRTILFCLLLLLGCIPIFAQDPVGIFDPERHGKLSKWEMQSVIDNLYIRLTQNSGWVGLILFDYDQSERRNEKLGRIKLIRKAIAYRKYDASRISIAIARKPSGLQYTILLGEKLFPIGQDDYTVFKLQELITNPDIAFPETKK